MSHNGKDWYAKLPYVLLPYIPFLRGSSKVPLGVYYTYFPDWQGLPDIAWTIFGAISGYYPSYIWILPWQCLAIFGHGDTCNAHNTLPVAFFFIQGDVRNTHQIQQ